MGERLASTPQSARIVTAKSSDLLSINGTQSARIRGVSTSLYNMTLATTENDIVEQIGTNIYNEKPDTSWPAVKHYMSTRFTTLFDLPILKAERRWYQILNPIPGLKEMNGKHWNFYLLGFFAWTVDALDFFCVSASASNIAHTLNVDIKQITWGLTLVLMTRSIGAVIFGLISDTYGRKWPYIAICFLFIVIEILTGFVQSYTQFLAVRAIFGILMGAMYPVASTTALEDQPTNARSILSGFFLPGYNLGYLLAIVFFRAFEFSYKGDEGWRALFWFSAGLPLILIIWRLFSPESETFLRLKESKKRHAQRNCEEAGEKRGLVSGFWNSPLMITMRTEWLMFIYLIFMMSGLNFISHGSQDLYPTFLVKQLNIGPDAKTVIMTVVNLGAICGGIFFGQLTELLGRRLTVVVTMVFSACFLYPSFYSSHVPTIIGGYFFLNFGVMGCWGVVPIHLMELVNTTHRSFLSGVAYQLGNLASSASSTIEADLGTKFPIKGKAADAYDYGKVMLIFCAAVFIYMIFIILIGPERFHKDLSVRDPYADDSDNESQESSDKSVEVSKPSVVHLETSEKPSLVHLETSEKPSTLHLETLEKPSP